MCGILPASRADALILVEDLRGCVKSSFEAMGAEERSGTPDAVDFADLLGDSDEAFSGVFLFDQRGREESG